MRTSSDERSLHFFYRFWKYQLERFPFHQHGFLIAAFCFSAVSFSRVCRGEDTFVDWRIFIPGMISSILFFFLLRVCDEFKDRDEDARYRPYRAVPRGLVTLKELALVGISVAGLIIIVNLLLMPRMLIAIGIVFGYMFLMTVEFFVPRWLKAHAITYMISHMVIMPLFDVYATGLDWLRLKIVPSPGIQLFLVVSFFNGIIIEFGRKIRAPQDEETGVQTYSSLYGPHKATIALIIIMIVAYAIAVAAAAYIGFVLIGTILLTIVLIACCIPAVLFLKKQNTKYGKLIETASGLWTLGMYLILGATPFIVTWITDIIEK